MWKDRLKTALEQSSQSTDRYFQIATVSAGGNPSNRTVVFRGFAEDSNGILISTDARSSKMADLKNNYIASLCWYFESTREQFRLVCDVGIISDTDHPIVESQWKDHSEASRKMFYQPAPGSEYSELSDERDMNLNHPAEHFAIVVCKPKEVDYLSLKTQPHTREIWTKDEKGEWNGKRVWA